MTKPTYKIVNGDDLSLTVVSNNKDLLFKTHQRWHFMMDSCKPFIPDHMMDKHNFKSRRFLILDMTDISKIDIDGQSTYSFTADTIELPDDKTVLEAIRDYYYKYKFEESRSKFYGVDSDIPITNQFTHILHNPDSTIGVNILNNINSKGDTISQIDLNTNSVKIKGKNIVIKEENNGNTNY